MATMTSCPRCAEKLRLPDDLRGQRVRCPQCSSIFEATDGSTPSPVPASRPAGLDVPLNLSLDDPDPAEPQPAAPRSQTVGAVEINQSPQDNGSPSPAAPPAQEPEPPPRSPSPPSRSDRPERARDRDRDDDMVSCPICRRSNHRDSRRCFHCGERLSDGPRSRSRYRDGHDDDDDYRRRRRDTEPHRGGLVLAMGIISLVSLALTFMLGVTVIIGIICGIIGWIMGHADLRKMRNNQMDPEGEGMTRGGWICSIIGTLLNLLLILACGGFIGFMIWMDTSSARTTRSRPPATIPVFKQQKDWPPPPQDQWKDFKDFPKDK
jgi:hypothetical protein